MRRRDLLCAVGATVLAPNAALSQPTIPVLGFLSSGAAGARKEQVAMLFRGLSDGGYVEGKKSRGRLSLG